MLVKRLYVSNFRNLKEQTIVFAPGINFISGQNGEGKTNLLEALNVLSVTKSFRTNKILELIAFGERSAAVNGTICDKTSEFDLAVGLDKDGRQFYLNQNKINSVLDYLGKLLTVSFSPTDLSLIKGAPAQRRKFLDKHLVDLQPSLMAHYMSFQKALLNKSSLLKVGVRDQRGLDPWNVIIAQSATQIISARRKLLNELMQHLKSPDVRLGAQDGEIELQLHSNLSCDCVEGDWKPIYEFLKAHSEREQRFKTAVFGPHRDEVLIKFGGRDTRAFASQGQTRSIVLSLKLAMLELLESKRGESPVVLLDDVDSELDRNRRENLLNLIFHKKRQVIITGTEYSVFESEKSHEVLIMFLKDGRCCETR